jgi:hypothetical protein
VVLEGWAFLLSEVPLYQVNKEVMEMNTEDSNEIDDASATGVPRS